MIRSGMNAGDAAVAAAAAVMAAASGGVPLPSLAGPNFSLDDDEDQEDLSSKRQPAQQAAAVVAANPLPAPALPASVPPSSNLIDLDELTVEMPAPADAQQPANPDPATS